MEKQKNRILCTFFPKLLGKSRVADRQRKPTINSSCLFTCDGERTIIQLISRCDRKEEKRKYDNFRLPENNLFSGGQRRKFGKPRVGQRRRILKAAILLMAVRILSSFPASTVEATAKAHFQ